MSLSTSSDDCFSVTGVRKKLWPAGRWYSERVWDQWGSKVSILPLRCPLGGKWLCLTSLHMVVHVDLRSLSWRAHSATFTFIKNVAYKQKWCSPALSTSFVNKSPGTKWNVFFFCLRANLKKKNDPNYVSLLKVCSWQYVSLVPRSPIPLWSGIWARD